jgi:hypothetical protein
MRQRAAVAPTFSPAATGRIRSFAEHRGATAGIWNITTIFMSTVDYEPGQRGGSEATSTNPLLLERLAGLEPATHSLEAVWFSFVFNESLRFDLDMRRSRGMALVCFANHVVVPDAPHLLIHRPKSQHAFRRQA